MKKFLLSSMAVLAGTSVLFAATQKISDVAPVKANVNSSAVKNVTDRFSTFKAEGLKKSVNVADIIAKRVAKARAAEGVELYGTYTPPAGTFFCNLSDEGRGYPFWYNAAFTKHIWGASVLTNDQTANPSIEWSYVNFINDIFDEATSDQLFIEQYMPSFEDLLLFNVPTLKVGDSVYKGGSYSAIVDGDGYSIIYGSDPDMFAEYGLLTYNPFETSYAGYNTYLSAGTLHPSDMDVSWSSAVEGIVLEDIKAELPDYNVESFKITGMGQFFEKTAAPVAYSSMKLIAAYGAPVGTKLTFTFYKVSDEGQMTDEILYQTDYITGASETEIAAREIEIEFTTTDEIGDMVGYKVFDSAMMMVISGVEKCDMFRAAVTGYDVLDPQLAYGYPASTSLIGDLTVNGQTITNTPFSLGNLGFYTDNSQQSAYNLASLYCSFEVEYPYVQPIAQYVVENDEISGLDVIPFENVTDVWFNMTEGQFKIYELVYSAESIDDINYTFGDEEQPDWIDLGVQEMTTEQGGIYSAIEFDIIKANETGAPRVCEITLSYKGASTTFRIHQSSDMTGIDNVGTDAEAAELDWNAPVYNVMGQKVSEGYKGIAIQNGKKFIVK